MTPAMAADPYHRALLDLATEVAREAAELAVELRRRGVEVADTKSSPVDVVTEADRAVEQLIRKRVLGSRPDDGFLGEEGDTVTGSSGVRWVVDPIDGTVNYLYGLPAWCVSVAATVGEDTVAGAVVAPALGEEYAGVRGGGATRNGVPVEVRPVPPLTESLVGTGFGYERSLRAHQAECAALMLPRVRDVRRMGSCALDLCAVGAGLLDAYVEEGPNAWDHAAGGLVAREAGARLELWRTPRDKDLVLCAPVGAWDRFAGLVKECGFDADRPGSESR